jgi:uncharacterized protein (DUF1330 family)
MAAYLVIDLDIHDAEGFDEYVRAVAGVLARYGGRYLVRRQAGEVLEGDWRPGRLTLIEFPSVARAREFYASPEFRAIVHLRHRAARTNLVLVEGVE